jgi:EAL and modified HD-GYP domain-containing signal transduction protein
MGYSFFQGYFFSKPVIVPGRDIPGYKFNYLKVLEELNKGDLDFRALEGVVKRDTSLCFTLLKYINSAYFGLKDKITSILHAMVFLGEIEVRKWASLVLLTFMGVDKPPEIIVRSLIRGQMCERLARDAGLGGHESELFLMGMFSLLDVLIGRPLEDILEAMNLTEGVKTSLLGGESAYSRLYRLVVSYESGDWVKVSEIVQDSGFDPERILQVYVDAVDWADKIAKAGGPQSN